MRPPRPPALALLALAAASAGCGTGRDGTSARSPERADAAATAPRVIATDLRVPWGVAFLPDGDALVAERTTGRIVRMRPNGRGRRVVMRVPGVDTGAGEGGLLGLAVSPAYRRDRFVYAYFTSGRDNRIVRFRLGGRLRPVLTGLERSTVHNGGRIAFGPDGRLYAAVGDAGDRRLAQDPASRNGKILRLEPDGSAPADNPRRGSLVWSLGHRNPQGLAWDRAGRLWAVEFGQNRFDEVNLIRKGANYGWPAVEGRGSTAGGRYVNPKVTWSTGDASPSGAAIAGRTLYIGALQGEAVLRVRLAGTRASKASPLFAGRFGRIRTVVAAPDRSLWATTSNRDGRGDPRRGDDRILRFRP